MLVQEVHVYINAPKWCSLPLQKPNKPVAPCQRVRIVGMDEAVAAVQGLGTGIDATWHAIDPRPPPPVHAVDGSHAVLVDNGAAWVVAVRATAVGPGRASPDLHIHATAASNGEVHAHGLADERGLERPSIRSADAWAAYLRDLAELDAATAALAAMDEGSLLLVDGALTGMPAAAQCIADRLLDRATARGIHIAGISKRSALADGDGPLLPRLHRDAMGKGVAPAWTSLNGCIAAVLHPSANHAFRVDGSSAVLPWLAALSNDAVYAGYPYPLAKAHNAVAIRHSEARRIMEHVHRGMGDAAWMLDDFHAVLDRNVAR